MPTVDEGGSEPQDPEYANLKSQLCSNWRENRPREFRQLEQSRELGTELTGRALALWELYKTMRLQGSAPHEARELLRDNIAPPLEVDHPWALMDLCDDLDDFDALLDEREKAVRVGGKFLEAWDNKITTLRRARGFD